MTTTLGIRNIFLLLTCASLFSVAAFAQPVEPAPLVFNLNDPTAIVPLGDGSFLVGQAGTRANTGNILFVDQFGDHAPLLLGLPSVGRNNRIPNTPSGPSGLALSGNNLYVSVPQIVPVNNSASLPLSAVLKFTFSRELKDVPGPFFLQPLDLQMLLAGNTLTLTQGTGNTASVVLVANNLNAVASLTADGAAGRLYIVSQVDGLISYVPLQ